MGSPLVGSRVVRPDGFAWGHWLCPEVRDGVLALEAERDRYKAALERIGSLGNAHNDTNLGDELERIVDEAFHG